MDGAGALPRAAPASSLSLSVYEDTGEGSRHRTPNLLALTDSLPQKTCAAATPATQPGLLVFGDGA